jgi:hypothetical protein
MGEGTLATRDKGLSELGGLLTFENVAARDDCLAQPAFKEFDALCKNASIYEYTVD